MNLSTAILLTWIITRHILVLAVAAVVPVVTRVVTVIIIPTIIQFLYEVILEKIGEH
jgi:hypothetical protein